jgi:hypothetical protein
MMVSGGWEVDRTGSESCPVVGFAISGVKILGSADRELAKFMQK